MGNENELWRTIPGEDERYEVSSLGRFRSWKRGNGIGRRNKPVLLSLRETNRGYLVVSFYRDKEPKTKLIHRLVAKAFLGLPPEGKPYALHKDDNSLNNTVKNLYWGSQKENRRDCRLNGNDNKGERCGTSKLTNKEVREIREKYDKLDIYQYELAEEYDVRQPLISRIINKKIWTHV